MDLRRERNKNVSSNSFWLKDDKDLIFSSRYILYKPKAYIWDFTVYQRKTI